MVKSLLNAPAPEDWQQLQHFWPALSDNRSWKPFWYFWECTCYTGFTIITVRFSSLPLVSVTIIAVWLNSWYILTFHCNFHLSWGRRTNIIDCFTFIYVLAISRYVVYFKFLSVWANYWGVYKITKVICFITTASAETVDWLQAYNHWSRLHTWWVIVLSKRLYKCYGAQLNRHIWDGSDKYHTIYWMKK